MYKILLQCQIISKAYTGKSALLTQSHWHNCTENISADLCLLTAILIFAHRMLLVDFKRRILCKYTAILKVSKQVQRHSVHGLLVTQFYHVIIITLLKTKSILALSLP